MKNKKKLVSIFVTSLLVFSLSGCGLKKQVGVSYKMNLEVWGVFDDQDDYSEIFKKYQEVNPQIEQISFRKLPPDTYEEDLVEALAAGKGPDIFFIQNNWLPGFQDKLALAPTEIVNVQMVEQEFVDAVSEDFLIDNGIYALPLSVDSLALFYNKDIFNRSGVVSPPTNWNEFKEDAQKMTRVDQFGNITQSGAALGTAYNINRSTDILNLFFLQSGGELFSDNGKGKISSINLVGGQMENAFKFYTQFSNSSSSAYSWNPRMHYSIDAFSEGSLAMMFNYSWQIEAIKNKSPKLNFGVAPVPQFDQGQKITQANYWGYAVAKNKNIVAEGSDEVLPTQEERIAEAWKFIKYLTFSPSTNLGNEDQTTNVQNSFDPAISYLTKTQKPAARRDLIEKQKTDIQLGIFALGNLYAKSVISFDPKRTEAVLAEMIERVVRGEVSHREALYAAQNKINKLNP